MKLVCAVFTTVSSGIVFSIAPVDKGHILTVLAPNNQTKYVARMMEAYHGERVDDVTAGESRYACFELRILIPDLGKTIAAVREMFVSMRTSRTTYYYMSGSAPDSEPDFIVEPTGEDHHFIVKMPHQPRSFTSKFTTRARGRFAVVGCTIVPDATAQAQLQLEAGRDEEAIVGRLAQLYDDLARAA